MVAISGPDGLTDAHVGAIVGAYALVESAQGEDLGDSIDVAERAAVEHGWADVRLLLHYARSLAAVERGIDDTDHVRAMLDGAAATGDPILLALALTTSATRRADTRRALDLAESASLPFVRAVGLLDGAAGLLVHHAGALIDVGVTAHALQLRELALELYDQADRLLDTDSDPRWAATVAGQRRVIACDRVDLVLDWASAQATLAAWPAAAAQAAAVLPGSLDAVDASWPPSWVVQYQAHVHLLGVFAGVDPPGPVDAPPRPDLRERVDAVNRLGRAISAARAGRSRTAARLADLLDGFVPPNTRLLSLNLVARRPDSVAALRYADELATLRWNARLDQVTGVRDAIAVERRRREHEHLRRQILVDELTGLANRRGYHTYLDNLPEPTSTDDAVGRYAVMMIDIDHFKAVNDTYGHDVGDIVLTHVARILSANVRPVDLAARLGGDEFVIILADTHPHVPEARARSIIDAVREHPWNDVAAGLTISVSIGVHHGGIHELPDLLSNADQHLYHAKRAGRGRFAAHQQPTDAPADSP